MTERRPAPSYGGKTFHPPPDVGAHHVLNPSLALMIACTATPGDLDGDGRADAVVEERRRTADGLVARDVVVLSGGDEKSFLRFRFGEMASDEVSAVAQG